MLEDTASPPSDLEYATYGLVLTPPRATQSQLSVYSTLATNISCGSQASGNTKHRLIELAPDGKRCLVTLDTGPLHCCHVFTLTTDYQTVSQLSLALYSTYPLLCPGAKLERAWGLDQGELHLHKTHNMIWREPFVLGIA
jgi:hypothetical protein